MDEERFDAIIVGGGLAGLSAAYRLAQEGLSVILVERSTSCGNKNVTGGKLCTHSIEKLFPDFMDIAPVERRISEERIYTWVKGESKDSDIDPHEYQLSTSPSCSVIRAKLDNWLSQQCEDAGVMIIQGILVTDLIIRDGKVCGIIADGDELEANVVILAEGINGMLAQKLGMIDELLPEETCVGTKEVIELGESVINERFELQSGEGVELMFLGDRSKGQYADGFLYTNKTSVSVGIEFLISDINNTNQSIPEMLEDFKELPQVSALIEGGRLIEYAAHLVRRTSSYKIGRLYGDGVLLVGDTAGLVANPGWVVRGMDLAVESGILAAETVINATKSGDYSEMALSSYQEAVENSFIASDIRACVDYLTAERGPNNG